LAREGVAVNIIQRQLGHTDLGTTSTYLQGIDPSEIIDAVRSRRQPTVSVNSSQPLGKPSRYSFGSDEPGSGSVYLAAGEATEQKRDGGAAGCSSSTPHTTRSAPPESSRSSWTSSRRSTAHKRRTVKPRSDGWGIKWPPVGSFFWPRSTQAFGGAVPPGPPPRCRPPARSDSHLTPPPKAETRRVAGTRLSDSRWALRRGAAAKSTISEALLRAAGDLSENAPKPAGYEAGLGARSREERYCDANHELRPSRSPRLIIGETHKPDL
jgi:hypothetical protein